MKIGDKVLIKGIIDEIRKDTIIIKNEGGYFGTVKEEVIPVPKLVEENPDWVILGKLQYGFSKGDYCLNCSNHPSNGGSGICHCTLGSPMIY